MKRFIYTVICLAFIWLNVGSVLAASVSGPTGQLINGWYKDSVGVSVSNVNSIRDCSVIVYSEGSSIISFLEGVHSYRIVEVSNGTLYSQTDSGAYNKWYGGCDNNPSAGSEIWSSQVKLDKSAPSLSVTSPANNTNTASSTVVVTGTVSDSASGISSVKVNNTNALVSGGSFSITISLTVGLNTISVVATDNVGHVTEAPSLTLLRSQSNSSSSPTSSNSSSPTSNNSSAGSTTTNNTGTTGQATGSSNEQGQTLAAENITGNEVNNSSQKKQTPSQPAITPNDSVSTPVKIAIGAGTMGILGLGIASFLGYIPYKKFGLIIAKLFARTS